MNKRIAVYPGSFDPFTIGHQSIVMRTLAFFDEVIVAIGVNEGKRRFIPLEEELERIKRYFANEPRIQVLSYEGLTVDLVREMNACVIVRGVRDLKDFEYERSIADINRCISDVETIYFSTLQSHSHVSSSAVRELIKLGKEVSNFLPSEKLYNP